jgi:hypothetical protein
MDKLMIELFGTTMKETDLAVLIDFGDQELWLPKSQLDEYPDEDDEGTVILPEWLAINEGLV